MFFNKFILSTAVILGFLTFAPSVTEARTHFSVNFQSNCVAYPAYPVSYYYPAPVTYVQPMYVQPHCCHCQPMPVAMPVYVAPRPSVGFGFFFR